MLNNMEGDLLHSNKQEPVSPTESIDVKPIFNERGSFDEGTSSQDFNDLSDSKKWSPGAWVDGNRKSAFQPYKQAMCTVLTNLQRGNTQAETPVPEETDINFHTRAGQGEITAQDILNEASVDDCDSNNLTALHWAASYGQLNSATLLINAGATIDCIGPDGETPLLLASSGGHQDVVRLLLVKGAKVNHVDDVGNTALMYAAQGDHPHCCNELLLHGADVTITNHCDETAFSLAIKWHSSLAQAVMENYFLTLLAPT